MQRERTEAVRFEALVFATLIAVVLACLVPVRAAGIADTVARVKPSIVAVGTMQNTRSPQFMFVATGFVVGGGNLIVTNAHVMNRDLIQGTDPEIWAIAIPSNDPRRSQVRPARQVADDLKHDLAVLKVDGPALPALRLRESASVRDGESFLMTGFPIGGVLGLYPVTHQMMIAAISPIAIPTPTAQGLDPRTVRRIQQGVFPIFQLDGTSYPGNSGSPLYDPATAEVVGVMNMAFVKGSRETALAQPSGITYAIPADYLRALLATVKD